MSRTARIERQTKESKVIVEVDLDGSGRTDISTGVGFYDHMLDAFGRHALLDLTVQTEGDTHIDAHHTVEDTAIVLGQALREALGDKAGIRRFGDATVPLDEALVQAVVDVSGRPYCVHTGSSRSRKNAPAPPTPSFSSRPYNRAVSTPCRCSVSSRASARACSSSRSPNWIDWVGHAVAHAGISPSVSRS